MNNKTLLNQVTINGASHKELQELAKANGIKASGKGVTAESLRKQLIALIPQEKSEPQPAPVPIASPTQNPVAKPASTMAKVWTLIQAKDGSATWEIEHVKRCSNDLMLKSQIYETIKLMLEGNDKYGKAIYRYTKAHESMNREFIDDSKLKGILKFVTKANCVDSYIMMLRQMRFIALAKTKRGTKYVIGNRLYEAYDMLSKEDFATA